MFDSLQPTDYNPLGSSVHGILQARIPEWVAIPFSRGSPQPRDQTQVSCTAVRFSTIWAMMEVQTLAYPVTIIKIYVTWDLYLLFCLKVCWLKPTFYKFLLNWHEQMDGMINE